MTRRREAQLAFDALSIEGGLLSPAWLARAAALQAGGQTEADYSVPKGLNLRDEIGRYWRIAQAHFADLRRGLGGADLAALSARVIRDLLREAFGFASIGPAPPLTLDERTYPIGNAALGGRVPVVLAPAGTGVDTLAPAFGDGSRRRSAFGLCQEYLNADPGALWGLCTDGLTLRVLRDNASLTRPAWIEADLQRIFAEERYADFAALWLLIHESRFGKLGEPATDCALERWREAGREEGTRAREHLRDGVEDALLSLGTGFLAHADNGALRAALASGELSLKGYFNELLRLVYRLIFLVTAEERGLLHPEGVPEAARRLYAEGYGVRRLRERSTRRGAHDRSFDLWEALRIVLAGLAKGEPRLGLPALAGLFDADQTPALDACRLENRHLLRAVFRLTWIREGRSLHRVNWRDMGPEELGSVYESLLELVPQVTEGGRALTFASGGETRGNARKTSGSYYTPDSLVKVLLDSALEPVVADTVAAHPDDPAAALLELRVVDPACGSGHFLLAAARRLGAHIARHQAGGTPSAAEYRHAVRQVVGRCIFGVDLNPMAVELCRVGLWMEAVEPGRPLSFLDAHIRQGNSLLGTTPELMEKGIPDEAWQPIEGDDRKVASALKKRNKAERAGQQSFALDFERATEGGTVALVHAVQAVDAASDGDLAAIEKKESAWQAFLDSQAYLGKQLVADCWCAAFVWRKEAGTAGPIAPTHEVWKAIEADPAKAPPALVAEVRRLADEYDFFHWHLAFPQVTAKGGFDVVLGNPPWEHVEVKEQEWFAARLPEIAAAANASVRKVMIEELREAAPALYSDFKAALRVADAENHLVRSGGRFPLAARGRINTYALFAEHNRAIAGPKGRAGFIVPTGISTDDTTKEYFAALVAGQELASFFSFENEEFVFPAVHHAFKFALITVDRSHSSTRADFFFFARQVVELADPARHFALAPTDFAVLNPNTRTCPTFRSRRDADLNLALYRRVGILWREEPEANPWALRFSQGLFNMASDSGLFRTDKGEDRLPLVEAKMVRHFDHRFGTYEGQTDAQDNQGKLPEFDDSAHGDPRRLTLPYYWVDAREVDKRLADHWTRSWLLGWRDIARSTDQRTVIASLIPRAAVGDTFLLAMPGVEPTLVAGLYACLCSFALDYAARQKVGGTHIKYNVFKQLPVLAPSRYGEHCAWLPAFTHLDFVLPRVLELTYTAWDLEPFAHDVGYDGPPFRWDPDRRCLLRAELDAAFFHLYGISHDDAAYIMNAFPIVRKNDERAHGEYRTKRVILEIFDEMAEAVRTGRPYQTRLDPPPADPRVAHPPRSGGGVATGSSA